MQIKKGQKAQDARDGSKTLSDYEISEAAIEAKTQRLKALRLARDAAAAETAPRPAASAKKKGAKKNERTTATLSDWLKDQQGGGRNS